jgi:hypothetical protein
LQVTADSGLTTQANRCEAIAEQLISTATPTGSGLHCQATAVAVNAAHGRVEMAGGAYAARIRTTAAKLAAPANAYVETDASSAAKLQAD